MQDADARVVDARDAAELARLIADHADGLLGRGGLLRDPRSQDHDRDHDHGSNRDHNDAQHDADGPTSHGRALLRLALDTTAAIGLLSRGYGPWSATPCPLMIRSR